MRVLGKQTFALLGAIFWASVMLACGPGPQPGHKEPVPIGWFELPCQEMRFTCLGSEKQVCQTSALALVPADSDWQEVVWLAQGEQVSISASGTWTFDRNMPQTDANGYPGARNAGATIPDANLGSLVARVGDGPPLLIGLQTRVVADREGCLLLRINDTADLEDNEGWLRVEIARVD